MAIHDGNTGWFRILRTTPTLTFASKATLVSETVTTTVAGAKQGDLVIVTPTTNLGSATGIWAYNAFVSAADTVSVQIHNTSAGTLDPDDVAWNVAVIQTSA